MARLILIAAIIVLVFWAYRRLTGPRSGRSGQRPPRETRTVRCDRCGVYLPEADATRHGDRVLCQEHRDAG